MAASYVCDGCGKAVASPKKIGHVIPRDYCETCAEKAESYLNEEEALRVRLQIDFANERSILIGKYLQGGFNLPDLP